MNLFDLIDEVRALLLRDLEQFPSREVLAALRRLDAIENSLIK